MPKTYHADFAFNPWVRECHTCGAHIGAQNPGPQCGTCEYIDAEHRRTETRRQRSTPDE